MNVGDFILVRRADTPGDTWYEGRVQFIEEKHVSVRFSDEFSTYRGTKFDVRFVLNRLPLRRMHNALMNKNDQERILFPGPSHVERAHRVPRRMIDELTPVNRLVGENPEQMETVAAILNMKQGSVPFIVFGPYVVRLAMHFSSDLLQTRNRENNNSCRNHQPNFVA